METLKLIPAHLLLRRGTKAARWQHLNTLTTFLHAGQVVRSIITVNSLHEKSARAAVSILGAGPGSLIFNGSDFCLSDIYLFLLWYKNNVFFYVGVRNNWLWFTVYLWVYQGHHILPVLFSYLTRRPHICLLLWLLESILSDIRPIFTSICPHFLKKEGENNSHFYESWIQSGHYYHWLNLLIYDNIWRNCVFISDHYASKCLIEL